MSADESTMTEPAAGHPVDELTSDAITSFATRALASHPALLRLRPRITTYGAATLTLQQAARIACLEPHYLSTVFRSHVGMTFIAWRRILRVVQAIKLIQTGACSIEAAARFVGYRHRRSLERAVMNVFGTTPRSLRQRVRRAGKPESGESQSMPQKP